jgi:hypothetical protein
MLVTEDTGNYQLKVRSAEKNAPAGRYELKVEELRTATAQDKLRFAAEKASAEAMRFYNQQTAEALRKAIEKYREALTIWRTLGVRDEEDGALNAIGGFHSLLRENQKAFSQALPLRRAASDRLGEGKTLSNIGLMHSRLGEKQRHSISIARRSPSIDCCRIGDTKVPPWAILAQPTASWVSIKRRWTSSTNRWCWRKPWMTGSARRQCLPAQQRRILRHAGWLRGEAEP